jgi:hypothetical protein
MDFGLGLQYRLVRIGRCGWALPTGYPIKSSTWTADFGITISDACFTDTATTVWVTGGVPHYLYRMINTITTAWGRTVDRALWFKICRS